MRERPPHLFNLQPRELCSQHLTLRRGVKPPFPPIVGASRLLDETAVDEPFEHTRQRLLRNAQDVEQIGDAEAWAPIDEMENAMMRSPEAVCRQHGVSLSSEVPVGKKQQLHQADRGFIDPYRASAVVFAHTLRPSQVGCFRIYVSHVDL